MEKVRLEMETLAVESFAIDELPEARGTVRAEEASCICNTTKIGGCWCTECC